MALGLPELDIAPLISAYRNKPLAYFQERLNAKDIEKWFGEMAILEAVPEAILQRKNIVVSSGHSLGKDYICGGLVPYFLEVYGPCIVITTAPTDRQVQKIMWGEITGHYNKAILKPPGNVLTQEIKIEPDWYAIGFTTKETNQAIGKFQGFHSPRVFVIASEAQAIGDDVFEQIDAVLTGEIGLLIEIGNPLRTQGRFAKDIKDSKNNLVIKLSCLDNPNYIERKTVVPGLASYEWVEDKRTRWGEADPRWISRVIGQIPEQAINVTFPDWLINHMKSRHTLLSMAQQLGGVAVDPAGEGVDDNEFVAGKGGDVLNTFSKTLMAPSDIAHQSVKMCKEIGGEFITLDCDGIGIGAYQELKKFDPSYLQGINIVKFHGSAPSETKLNGRKIYENMRTEASFLTQARAKAGKASINFKSVELIEDLQEETYFTNKKGFLQIEPKEDIKERLKRSPGKADAYKMLQWAFEKGFKRLTTFSRRGKSLPREQITEYDVLAH